MVVGCGGGGGEQLKELSGTATEQGDDRGRLIAALPPSARFPPTRSAIKQLSKPSVTLHLSARCLRGMSPHLPNTSSGNDAPKRPAQGRGGQHCCPAPRRTWVQVPDCTKRKSVSPSQTQSGQMETLRVHSH